MRLLVCIVPLNLRERHRFYDSFELFELRFILQNSPKIRQLVVDVVDDFGDSFSRFVEQDRATAKERLHIVDMFRHQFNDSRGQVVFTAVPFQRLNELFWLTHRNGPFRRGRVCNCGKFPYVPDTFSHSRE